MEPDLEGDLELASEEDLEVVSEQGLEGGLEEDLEAVSEVVLEGDLEEASGEVSEALWVEGVPEQLQGIQDFSRVQPIFLRIGCRLILRMEGDENLI